MPKQKATTPIRALVVDDDQVDRMAVRRTLASVGRAVEVEEASGVLAAIERVASAPFDCVILDYHLPDGDGLTFLRGLRAAGLTTPVIMLTGQGETSMVAELMAAGAADYVPKSELSAARLDLSLRKALPNR